MSRTVVCFGDSNTHGAHPETGARLGPDERWPGVMAAALGDGYRVIEEALNGRTTMWDSPLAPHRNGLTYLVPCLLSHAPVDLVLIMLGTNDLKAIHGLGAPEIASAAGILVDAARQTLAGPDGGPPGVMLVAPVPVGPTTARSEVWGFGAAIETSRQLGRMYAVIAEGRGIPFFDAGSVATVSPADGVHLDVESHAALGTALAGEVRAAVGDAA